MLKFLVVLVAVTVVVAQGFLVGLLLAATPNLVALAVTAIFALVIVGGSSMLLADLLSDNII